MRIEVTGLEARLPGTETPLFHLPSLTVEHGARLLIHGPSGCGKTTLLHLLAGQFPPHAGSIRAGDTELTALSGAERARFRRKHFGIVFQQANLIEHFTVAENIAVGLHPGRSDARDRVEEAARRTGVAHLTGRRANLLSPGERQRVAVARIHAAAPDVVFADEPTSSLDLPGAENILGTLWDVSEGKTLVVVSHDLRIANRFDAVFDFAARAAGPAASVPGESIPMSGARA